MMKCLLLCSVLLVCLIPRPGAAISVTSPGDLAAADFWAYVDATNGALSRIEDRGSSAVGVETLHPVIGGIGVSGNLTAENATTAGGPATTVNANLTYSGATAFDTSITLYSQVIFDLAAFGTGSQASVRINGGGIGGVTGNFFGQFGQASATTSGYVTVYETNATGGYGAIVDSWSIPSSFTDTVIDSVLTLDTSRLYKVIVRSQADIRLFNVDNFNLSAYMIADPVFTSETAGVDVFVSPGASPVPLPGAVWLIGSGPLALAGMAGWRKPA